MQKFILIGLCMLLVALFATVGVWYLLQNEFSNDGDRVPHELRAG